MIAANSSAYWNRKPWPESGKRCNWPRALRNIFHMSTLFSVGSRRSSQPTEEQDIYVSMGNRDGTRMQV